MGADAVTHVARNGLANRVNAVMEMLCRGDGKLIWVINDQCSLGFEDVFPRLDGLDVTTRHYWAEGDVCQWWVSSRHSGSVVRAVAERLVRAMAGWEDDGAVDALAIHGRWLDRMGGRHAVPFASKIRRTWRGLAGGKFLLTDCFAGEISSVLPWPVDLQASEPMSQDRDRADRETQLAFLRDLQRLWRAGTAVTNNPRSTIPDMRSYLGRPTWVVGAARREDWVGRCGWWRGIGA